MARSGANRVLKLALIVLAFQATPVANVEVSGGGNATRIQGDSNVLGASGSDSNVLGASRSDSRVLGASGSDSNVLGASGSDSNVLGASGSDSRVLGASGSDSRVLGASGSDSRVLGASGSDSRVLGASGSHSNVLGASGSDSNVLGASGSDSNVLGASGSDSNVLGASGSDSNVLGESGSDSNILGASGSDSNILGASRGHLGDPRRVKWRPWNLAGRGRGGSGWPGDTRYGPNRLHPHLSNTRANYIITAPRLARPSTVYRVVVGLLRGTSPVMVTANLAAPGVHLDPARAVIAPGDTQDLLIQVPHSNGVHSYTLLVEGHQGKTLVFRNSTQVQASAIFLTILLHLSRPCFTGNQEVGVRALLLTTDLKPYDDPVDIFILDPQSNVVKRWVSRSPHVGVVTVTYQLPEWPLPGWWKVRVNAQGQVQEKSFLVHKVYEPFYEVLAIM